MTATGTDTDSAVERWVPEALVRHAVRWLLPALIAPLEGTVRQCRPFDGVAGSLAACGEGHQELHDAAVRAMVAVDAATKEFRRFHTSYELTREKVLPQYLELRVIWEVSHSTHTGILSLWEDVERDDYKYGGRAICDDGRLYDRITTLVRGCYSCSYRGPLAATADGLVASLVASGVDPEVAEHATMASVGASGAGGPHHDSGTARR